MAFIEYNLSYLVPVKQFIETNNGIVFRIILRDDDNLTVFLVYEFKK